VAQGRVSERPDPAPDSTKLLAAVLTGGEAQPRDGAEAQEARPPFGHARQTRAWAVEPDRIVEAQVESCGYCQADLRGVEPRAVLRRQLTELPPITPVMIETRQAEVVCPDCQRITRGELPAGLVGEWSLGPRLAATVVYLKHEQHLSYERVTQLCQDRFGVPISVGPDNRFRVFYRVEQSIREVHVLAIGIKIGNQLFIGKEEFLL